MRDGPILITGGEGQLARALDREMHATTWAAVRVGRPTFDFDQLDRAEAVVRRAAPSILINAAAYTAVDAAETDAPAAWRANHAGPARLAAIAAELGFPLIHISTDYVYDGRKGAPYVENDPTAPQGVYGASKLAGEQAVLGSPARTVVLRTSWVYAAEGKNFVRTMLNAAPQAKRLRVVDDQLGCPTAADDLARAIVSIVLRLRQEGWQECFGGVFHAAGTGWTSWCGLAIAIFEEAARHGVMAPEIEPIATTEWPTPARRPPDSRLDCGKLARTFGARLPAWRESLGVTIDRILASRG